jgi:hypothetical protein
MVSRIAQNSTIEAAPRELDSRTTSDGIYVRLVWHPRDERVTVVVEDPQIGEAFELAVGPGQRALDVFHHPYAYAADTRDRERLATQTAHTKRVTTARPTIRPLKRLQ